MTKDELAQMSDSDLKELHQQVGAEIEARRVVREAEEQARRIAEEAEARRQELAARFIMARDREQESNTPAPQWVSPTGPHDLYSVDYVVSHKGRVWRNTHPANSWEPGTTNSQWIQVIEDDGQGTPPVIAWGTGQDVKYGDIRWYEGIKWRAKIAHVTHEGWVPSEFTHAVWENLGPLKPEDEEDSTTEPTPDPEPEPEPEPETPPAPQFPTWSASATYKVGDKVVLNGRLYECLAPHGAEYQGTWKPGVAHSVWRDLGAL